MRDFVISFPLKLKKLYLATAIKYHHIAQNQNVNLDRLPFTVFYKGVTKTVCAGLPMCKKIT